MLTQERLKELIHYDPLTGLFTRIALVKHSKAKLGPITGYAKKEGHLKVCVDGKEYYLARLAHLYMTGTLGHIVDHRDGNPVNNIWLNLRNTNKIGNVQNQVRPHKTNTSGYLGVNFRKDKNKFVAEIYVNNRKHHLGYFACPQIAHEAYLVAKRQLHATCTI